MSDDYLDGDPGDLVDPAIWPRLSAWLEAGAKGLEQLRAQLVERDAEIEAFNVWMRLKYPAVPLREARAEVAAIRAALGGK